MKIVVTDGFPMNPGDMDWRELAGPEELTVYPRTAPSETVARLTGAEAAVINKVKLSAEVLERLPGLRYIGLCSSGCDAVDVAAARRLGITVTNVPGYSTMGVAQLTFAHILNIANRVQTHAADVASGGWSTAADFCYTLTPQTELDGKVLGLVGTGAIARAAARIGAALGMRVIGCSRSGRPAEGIELTDFTDLCHRADIVSLHCPLTEETRNLINDATLAGFKDGAWLINTARGGLVDARALAAALESGKIGAAGLDVLPAEPPPEDNPLLKAKNCFITPHLAWMTREARRRLFTVVAANLQAWRDGKAVNTVG